MVNIFPGFNTEELQVNIFVTKLNNSTNKATQASHKDNSSLYTSTISSLNKVRDNDFVYFRNSADAATHSSDVATADAAQYIIRAIKTNGWSLHRTGSNVQTAIMKSLKQDLSTTEAQQAIATLNLTSAYNAMIASEDNYVAEVSKRSNESVEKSLINPETAYKEMLNDGENLIKAIEVFYNLTGKSEYQNMAAKINELTAEVMAIARARQTRAESHNQEIPVN